MISWLCATDHKKIGIMYVVTTMTFFVIAGLLAMAIRAQLARPESTLWTGCGTVSAHQESSKEQPPQDRQNDPSQTAQNER